MAEYAAPLRDIRFVLEHLVDLAALAKLPEFDHADPDTTFGLLEEYGRFMAEQIAPLDRVGDTVGLKHDPATGAVTTPPGFERGLHSATSTPAGGRGRSTPTTAAAGSRGSSAIAMQEMLTSANMGFSICPLLTQGAIDMLEHHGRRGAEGAATCGRWSPASGRAR